MLGFQEGVSGEGGKGSRFDGVRSSKMEVVLHQYNKRKERCLANMAMYVDSVVPMPREVAKC